MTYIKLWCEYDYGQDSVIFESEEKALTWLQDQIIAVDGLEFMLETCYDAANLHEDGLCGFLDITLIKD